MFICVGEGICWNFSPNFQRFPVSGGATVHIGQYVMESENKLNNEYIQGCINLFGVGRIKSFLNELILGHSISFAGWLYICQWVRQVSLGLLSHSTMLTISYWLTRRVSLYKHLVSYLMSYPSVHFWVLFFCTTFYTTFHRICITPLQIDSCSLYQRSLSS